MLGAPWGASGDWQWGLQHVSDESIGAGYLAHASGSAVLLQQYNKRRMKGEMNLRLAWAASFRPCLNHKLSDILFVNPSWILKAAWRSLEESSITEWENDYCRKALLGLTYCQWSIIVLLTTSIWCWMCLLFYCLILWRHRVLLKALKMYSVPWPKCSRWGNRFSHSYWLSSLLL